MTAPNRSIEPMLAKSVPTVPAADSVEGGLSYEPKWDGFRAIVTVDDEGVEIGSRGGKSLARYFPELIDAFAAQLPVGTVLDGEIVLRRGNDRLDWEALSARIHPAAKRVTELANSTPASFVAFDLLTESDESLAERPFGERRARLEQLRPSLTDPLFVTTSTRDAELAQRWLVEFEGAGLDGVVAKPLDAPYRPGKRTMFKIKHSRTADVVLFGYRMHASGIGVGSLLLALYNADGELRQVGGASAFTDARRLQLIDELAPLVLRDNDGNPLAAEGERNRFSSSRSTAFVPLRPERVLEVRYDQMEGDRFRHTVQFVRWRDDRDAGSCRFDQLEVPGAYDLSEVLGG